MSMPSPSIASAERDAVLGLGEPSRLYAAVNDPVEDRSDRLRRALDAVGAEDLSQ